MAQFDVYRNPSPVSREGIPYFVDIQSDLLAGIQTRLLMPLARASLVPSKGPRALCPEVEILGESLRALAHLIAPLRPRELGRPVASLAAHSSSLVAALDAVISGV